MPPQQKNLRKLLSQAQKKQGKNETVLPPESKPKPKPKKPPTSYKVSKQNEEELAYQEFLAQLDFSKDPNQIRMMIDEFATATAGKFQGRQVLLQNIFNTLPPHLWFTFVQEFTAQKDKGLNDFYNIYLESTDDPIVIRKAELGTLIATKKYNIQQLREKKDVTLDALKKSEIADEIATSKKELKLYTEELEEIKDVLPSVLEDIKQFRLAKIAEEVAEQLDEEELAETIPITETITQPKHKSQRRSII